MAHHLRADSFPRYLLSQVRGNASERPLHILDAGCGTGASLIPIAALHQEARVVGVDLSPAAVDAVREQARRRGFDNLEAHQIDLMDASAVASLRDGSPDGFDVIYASGVLHHLADPERGLGHLAGLLAASGVMSVMVYGHYGRLPVTRIARAIELVRPAASAEHAISDERLAFARRLVSSLGMGSVAQPPWNDGDAIGNVELVDRYLHVHARSYTVTELFALIEGAGLRWLRWLEPRAWSPVHIFGSGELADEIAALAEPERYQVIEQLFDRRALECLVTGKDAGPRPGPTAEELPRATIDRNPQVTVRTTERRVAADGWIEGVSVRLRAGPDEELTGIGAALVQACRGPMPAEALVEEVQALAWVEGDAAYAALRELVAGEILYVV